MKTKPGHLLVVDHDGPNQQALTRSLLPAGHTVETAGTGAEALEKIRRAPFDVVLLNYEMPGMNGYEVLGRIRDDHTIKDKDVPVIMLSGSGELEFVIHCFERGASDYLLEPWDAAVLRARVDNCLEKKRAREEAQRLYAELQEKHRALQEAERLRDDLAHMIVHDLRTPLTSLLTGMMTMETLGPLNADQHEFVDAAIHGGQTLLGMINDLLDISKMEAGSLALDRKLIDVADLVAHATQQVTWLLESNDQFLVCEVAEGLPPLFADQDKLGRVLTNLLGNAVKFTPHDGIITVSVEEAEEGGLQFDVRDTGVGIPPEAFGRIFEKFGQVSSRNAGHTRSTGLGLTFCKMVVEAHGGRIWVESALDQGSVFSFVIPCQPIGEPA